jgi:hypothetical protein
MILDEKSSTNLRWIKVILLVAHVQFISLQYDETILGTTATTRGQPKSANIGWVVILIATVTD